MSSTATIDGLKSCALQDETLKCSLDKLPSLAGASFLPLMFCGTTAHVSDFPRLWLLRASEDLIHILPVTEYTLIQGISFAVCVEKDRSKGSGVKVTSRSSPEEVYSKTVVDECFCWVRVFKHYPKRGLTLKNHLFSPGLILKRDIQTVAWVDPLQTLSLYISSGGWSYHIRYTQRE